MECLKRVISLYNLRGFYVHYILADGEFRHMTGDIISEFQCHLNCTATGEHVPEAERAVRAIKERIRCIVTTWPYNKVPQIFKISLMKFVIFWLNSIPQQNSILPNICSKAIMTRQFPDYTKHYQIGIRTYVHVHNPRNITNTMAPRTSLAITLGPISNLQGSHRFFCLHTKRIITCRQWTELPTPTNVIELINDKAMKERNRTKKKKDQRKPTSEYSISSNNDPHIISSNDVQDHYVPIPTNNISHGNPIDQITSSPTNTSDSDDESINNTDTNENTNKNQNDANINDDTTTKDECPPPTTKDAPTDNNNTINTTKD